jgi:hypothetical protein
LRIGHRPLVLAAVLLAVPLARGGNEGATVGLFLTDPVTSRQCDRITPPDCEDENLQVEGETFGYYTAYVCLFNGDGNEGFAGVEFGLAYDSGPSGVQIFNWTRCSDLEFPAPNWPSPGSGTVATWDKDNNCQTDEPGGFGEGVTAVIGAFYLSSYGDGLFEITPRPVSGKLAVSNCESAEAVLRSDQAAALAFSSDGSLEGRRGCTAIEVTDTTWGGVKQQYGNDR